ncbi:MAG: GtrA family protein [Chloroflexi bacterium]|nr:GtrA family protein [Chloroflexota bacterium]
MSKLLTLVEDRQDELGRFTKFAIVGAIGAAVDFSVLNFLILVLGWSNVFVNVSLPIVVLNPLLSGLDWGKFFANLFSVGCAIISNFVWNRYWTFPESRERRLRTQFGKFALVNLVGLGINQVVFLTLDALVFAPVFPEPLDYNLAKGMAIIMVLFWNFSANRRWTYKGI